VQELNRSQKSTGKGKKGKKGKRGYDSDQDICGKYNWEDIEGMGDPECNPAAYDEKYGSARNGGWNDGALGTARKTKRARHVDEKVPGRVAGGVYTNMREEPVEPFSGLGKQLGR
jgi:hypothetical protein